MLELSELIGVVLFRLFSMAHQSQFWAFSSRMYRSNRLRWVAGWKNVCHSPSWLVLLLRAYKCGFLRGLVYNHLQQVFSLLIFSHYKIFAFEVESWLLFITVARTEFAVCTAVMFLSLACGDSFKSFRSGDPLIFLTGCLIGTKNRSADLADQETFCFTTCSIDFGAVSLFMARAWCVRLNEPRSRILL